MPLSCFVYAAAIGILTLKVDTQVTNYPESLARPTWCVVPNYRYYRVTPTKARGFPISHALHCGLQDGKPDDCFCADASECLSGFCVPDDTGAPLCNSPVVQIAEVEFWRSSRHVNTAKIRDDDHDAFRVRNGVDVSQVWGVWELEFYSDTLCSDQLLGGVPVASSQRPKGFGHSIDHTAPLGGHEASRTYWQATHELPLEHFEMHGPAAFAFDGDLRTNWWPTCRGPCLAHTEWIGLNFSAVQPSMRCVRIIQDKDRDYAAFSLLAEGHRAGTGTWETFAAFNAATWDYGGVWERLSIPQGVSFVASSGHARLMDRDLGSSVVELVGAPLEFDFGVETEIDGWRWATAEEPTENLAQEHDGYTCDRDGRCPRDPVEWRLEGSLDRVDWLTIQEQDAPYPVTVYRKRFLPMLAVHHKLDLSILDMWPDGRGTCAVRR